MPQSSCFISLFLLITFSACNKPVTTVTPGTTPSTGKSPIVGLVCQGSAKPEDSTWIPDNTFPEANVHPGIYSAVVIRLQWKQLEPQRGQFTFSVLDNALTNIRSYNILHPATPLRGKLRIFSGVNAPGWAKALSGGPVSLTDNNGNTISVPRFWAPDCRAAWQELQIALAAKYDTLSLLQEVAVSTAATLTAEPFIQPFNNVTLPLLHAAGFTDNLFKATLLGALDDYATWKQTALDYTFNPFRATDGANPVVDTAVAPMIMNAFRTRYGSRAVIANHGLQSPISVEQGYLYAYFTTLGKPIEFQTVAPNVDWNSSIANGLAYHATEIEIWDTQAAGGYANVSLPQLQLWATQVGR